MRKKILGLLYAAPLAGMLFASGVFADSFTTNFESFNLGTINGQEGWSSLGSVGQGCAEYDVEVVENTYGYSSFGSQSLRISNAVTQGCFDDQTISPSLTNEAGETSAMGDGKSGGARQPYFEAAWDFASADPNNEQAGLVVGASPDRGDGARMSLLYMMDTPSGLEVGFYDYQIGNSVDDGPCACPPFRYTTIASGLDRTVAHNLKVTMEFLDGTEDDVVEVYIDGNLVHTGLSWEDYFREEESNPSRTVDSVLFRVSGTAAPATDGKGFLIDNFSLYSGPVPIDPVPPPTTTTDCKDGSWETYNAPGFSGPVACITYVVFNDPEYDNYRERAQALSAEPRQYYRELLPPSPGVNRRWGTR